MICEADIEAAIRFTNWAEELAAAQSRYSETPRWRYFRRRINRASMESCRWFLEQQEAGRL